MRNTSSPFAFCFALSLLIATASLGLAAPAPPDAKDEKKPAGTVLVYQIDPSSKPADPPADLKKAIAILDKRINTGWLPRARIRETPGQRIEITVFKSDPASVEQVERRVTLAGTLEFRILANTRDHRALIDRAEKSDSEKLFAEKSPGEEPKLLAWWVSVKSEVERSFRGESDIATRTVRRNGKDTLEILVVNDRFNVTGKHLRAATPDGDPGGRPCIYIQFTKEGGQLFGELTSHNLPDPADDFSRKLGIILNGQLHSAPRIMSAIYDRAQISGTFTQQEVQDLAAVLGAGSLPVRLKRVDDAQNRR
jgi:SecD/SecF fusion protein